MALAALVDPAALAAITALAAKEVPWICMSIVDIISHDNSDHNSPSHDSRIVDFWYGK